MSGELEAAGAMATAGLVAGAIEGKSQTRAGEGACLNCGAELSGNYCAQCGQAAHPHRSLFHMLEEVLHGLFHFETKAWRTLPMMLFRPGTLTRNYVFGKRARYISPLALFLFCVFFMFFVFSLIPPPANVSATTPRQSAREQLQEARAGLREAQNGLAEMHRQAAGAANPASQGQTQTALEHAVTLAEAEVARREAAVAAAEAPVPGGQNARGGSRGDAGQSEALTTSASNGVISVTTTRSPEEEAAAQAAPSDYRPGSLEDAMQRASRENISVLDNPHLSERIRHKLANPPLLLYQLQQAAYKFSFLLVPISLPFIGFLFLFKRGVTLYDHTVFALYALSFASILFVLMVTAGAVPWLRWLPGGAIAFGLPVHTFFHLKGAYQLGWWSALWRTLFMLIFALAALVIFLALIVFVGFAE